MNKTGTVKVREEVFHDEWARSIDPSTVKVRESFTACTAPECRQIISWLGEVKGKEILDLGCGAGEAATFFALSGAVVTASDISTEMLRTVKNVAEHHRVQIDTKQAILPELPFKNKSFDIVYAGNLLHHVPLESTLIEINRILKPGGSLVSWDPLSHNPAINIYRMLATEVRTPDEHPLSIGDINLFRNIFTEVKWNCFWLTTLAIFFRFYLFERVDPNKERYWKKIIDEHKRLEAIYKPLEKIDKLLLRYIPYLKRYCWNVAIIASKSNS